MALHGLIYLVLGLMCKHFGLFFLKAAQALDTVRTGVPTIAVYLSAFVYTFLLLFSISELTSAWSIIEFRVFAGFMTDSLHLLVDVLVNLCDAGYLQHSVY